MPFEARPVIHEGASMRVSNAAAPAFGDFRDVVEPLAKPFALGVGIQRNLGIGLVRGFNRGLPRPLARQAVDVRGTADHQELDVLHPLGGGLLDGNDFRFEVRPEAVGDVVGHDVRVAVHRLVDDECSHGSSMRQPAASAPRAEGPRSHRLMGRLSLAERHPDPHDGFDASPCSPASGCFVVRRPARRVRRRLPTGLRSIRFGRAQTCRRRHGRRIRRRDGTPLPPAAPRCGGRRDHGDRGGARPLPSRREQRRGPRRARGSGERHPDRLRCRLAP